MLIAVLSLFAGALSVLAPCVLPFLPVIIGGSVGPGSKRRPYLIAISLVVSLIAFTLLLKASTLLIDIDPKFWTIASGSLVIALGIAMLIPGLWAWVAQKLRLGERSHSLLHAAKASDKGETAKALITGAALGPVFSSCSPTYAWVIATVLPAQPAAAMFYLSAYCIGMAGTLLAISLAGRKLIDRLGWAANPSGWFQRLVAVLFILVGLAVATGVDKQIQTWAVEKLPGISAIEQQLLPEEGTSGDEPARMSSLGSAPELVGIQDWINTEPLQLSQLKGKVVLVDFWTYSCINCIRTQPYLNAWYDRYHDKGFEIIGVHAPEFAFEKLPENVRKAVVDAQIKYPVALDNDFKTWRAYSNRYWPAKYLVNQNGEVVWTHFGEGDYEEAEENIRKLLDEQGQRAQADGAEMSYTPGQSPETYLGSMRAAGYTGSPSLSDGDLTFEPTEHLALNQWTLAGNWHVDHESITAQADGASLSYRFTGREMFLVMDGPAGSSVKVETESGVPAGGIDVVDQHISVGEARLYKIIRLDKPTDGLQVKLTFSKGVSANAFTFG